MKVIETNEMIQLVFPPKENKLNSYNVYIFQINNKGIIIDSGNEENGRDVCNFIKDRNIDIKGIVFSHYHLDHIGGYSYFDNIPIIIGSENFNQVLSLCESISKKEKFYPTHGVTESVSEFTIANIKIRCKKSPGHSPCSIITEINNKYLHVGDLIINSDDGADLLPLGWYELIDDHINSLQWLANHTNKIMISGHGVIECDEKRKLQSINGRIEYLTNIKNTKGRIDIKNALLTNPVNFKHLFWHEQNLSC